MLGKVFWAGAVAAMGEQEGEVREALHELSRKELVHPARATTMEGEAEYSFSHVLIRDVAYAQIPRGSRAERHCLAAGSIEQKAPEQIEGPRRRACSPLRAGARADAIGRRRCRPSRRTRSAVPCPRRRQGACARRPSRGAKLRPSPRAPPTGAPRLRTAPDGLGAGVDARRKLRGGDRHARARGADPPRPKSARRGRPSAAPVCPLTREVQRGAGAGECGGGDRSARGLRARVTVGRSVRSDGWDLVPAGG